MQNFKSSVPAPLQAKIKAFADAVDFSELVTGHKAHEYYTEQRTDEILGVSAPGWVPFQDGGYSVSQLFRCDQDSSYHFTEKQTDFINEQSKDCWNAFCSDNGIDRDVSWEDLTDEQQNECSEYENEWFSDGAMLQLQIFVDGYTEWRADDKQVTIRLSINYADAPYFREKSAEDIKTVILTVDEFMAADIAELVKQFTV